MKLGNYFGEFTRRARRIWHIAGAMTFSKALVRFLLYPLFQKVDYRLYRSEVDSDYKLTKRNKNVFKDKLNFQILRSNEEAEKLEAEGMSFRSYPTPFNNYLTTYGHWLDSGAIAFCTFVDKEFAAICWAVTSRQTQLAIKAPLIHVDYDNHEVLLRGAWVNPKYRGMDLYRYNWCNRERYLSEMGITGLKSTIDYSSKIGKPFVEALGQKQYGRARSLKIFWVKFWKEYPN